METQTQETPQTATAETNVISKMSVKALGCNPRAVAAKPEGDNTPVRLCQIYGTADGIKTGESAAGVWTCLTGNFEGRNIDTGAIFKSGKLFLPGGIQEIVENGLKGTEGKEDAVVQFALEIRAVKASNPIGYSYQAVPLVQPAAADPLQMLRDAVAKYMPPAPSAPKEIEAPKPEHKTPAPAAATVGGKKK